MAPRRFRYKSLKRPLKQSRSTLQPVDLDAIRGDIDIFVETGTNIGHGVKKALDYDFKRVISFEQNKTLYRSCVKRFRNNDRVELHLGHSESRLFQKLNDIEGRMLFFLDAHDWGSNPLLSELEAIKKLKRNDHIIMIDDVRMFGTPHWSHLTKQDTIDKLMEVNKDYNITYTANSIQPDDIMIATP